jgi:hypothetical protein
MRKIIMAALAATTLAAVPAAAQTYDDRYRDRYRNRDTVEEVVDGVVRVADAVNRVTGRYGYCYGRGIESHAANACAYEAQRRFGYRYGGTADVHIQDVQWYRRDRMRVFGTADLRRDYGRYGRYNRYDDRYGAGRISFACTVRADGRVTDFDSNRNRYRGYRY